MINSVNIELLIPNYLPPDTKFGLDINSQYLLKYGFVMPVIVQTPSFLCSPPFSKPLRTIVAMALLDTGASSTAISRIIANYLNLDPIGFSQINTAAGQAVYPDFSVDILFPSVALKSFENIKVGTCDLPFDLNLPIDEYSSKNNFGVLIGRDMMSRWNIVWNGPTSSVFISE